MSGFCHKLAALFYKWGILDNEEDINPLRFSFELIITEMITYITMLIIGIVINRFYETVIYGVVFGILRKRIQGYHAKTFKMCTLIYSTVIFMRVIGGQDENSDS